MTLKCKHGLILYGKSCLKCDREEVDEALKEMVDAKIKEVSAEWGAPIDMLLGSKCTRENIQEFLKVTRKGVNDNASISKSKT